MQARIEGFVLRNYYALDREQMLATVMMEFSLYYDDAKRMVERAYSTIRRG